MCRFYHKYEKISSIWTPFFNSNCSLNVDAEVLKSVVFIFSLLNKCKDDQEK